MASSRALTETSLNEEPIADEESAPLIGTSSAPTPVQLLVVPALCTVHLSFSATSCLQSNMMRSIAVDAVVFSFLRCSLSAIVLLTIAATSREGLALPTAQDIGPLLLVGLCGVYFGQLFLLLALQQISVLNASVISAMQPIVTMLVGHLLRIELIELGSRSGRLKIAGVLLAVGGGTTIIVSQSGGDATAPGDWLLGNLFAVLFCLGNGCYPLAQKHLLNHSRLSPANITGWGMLTGSLLIGICLPVSHFEAADWRLPARAVGVLVFTTLVASVLAYTLLTWAIANSTPVFVIGFSPLQLVLTASFAAIFLGDATDGVELVGMGLVCVGLWTLGASRLADGRSPRKV